MLLHLDSAEAGHKPGLFAFVAQPILAVRVSLVAATLRRNLRLYCMHPEVIP